MIFHMLKLETGLASKPALTIHLLCSLVTYTMHLCVSLVGVNKCGLFWGLNPAHDNMWNAFDKARSDIKLGCYFEC